MSTTSKNKILLITVIVLLLTNIAMLVFFLNKGGERRRPHGGGREAMMTEFLKKEVGFTPQQLVQYDTLSKQHRATMKTSFDKMRSSKEQQLKDLGAGAFSDSAINIAATQSSVMQKDIELGMLKHIATIRALCTPEQQPKFDSLFYKVWNRRGDNNKKPGTKN